MSARGVRPMTAADIPAVGRLFNRVFRARNAASSPDFNAYFAEQCFGSPVFAPDAGSIVHADRDGRITGAIGVVPMQVRAGERVVTGRLMSIYMTDPQSRGSGGAELVLTIRPRHQDFCFCDSANAVSADHYKAIGGMMLPVHSLAWYRVFRPLGQMIAGKERRIPRLLRSAPGAVAGPFDRAMRAVRTNLRATSTTSATAIAIEPETFAALAPAMLARFQVAPVWAAPELTWLLGMAARNTVHGALHLYAVEDRGGQTIGAFAYYGGRGRIAQVLNILALAAAETDVVAAMFHHLDQAGCTGATGPAQPFLMDALCRQPRLSFRHRGYVCLSTRHPDIREAAERGDIYLGGLMGESWSRLMADFN